MLVLGLFCWGDNAVMGANQSAETLNKQIVKPVECQYLLSLPQGYGEKDRKWPLMLFLHGAGERGDDLNKVKVHGPPKLIEQGKELPFIVVAPQCAAGLWWPQTPRQSPGVWHPFRRGAPRGRARHPRR